MDDSLPAHNDAVAAAADAHLRDPLDTAIYARLVSAVLARREHLAGTRRIVGPDEPKRMLSVVDDTPPVDLELEVADADLAVPAALDLAGDPRDVMARLRGLRPPSTERDPAE